MNYPPIDIWRMSASRPWQLKDTHQSLFDHLKYDGELRFHLIESILVREYSDECIHWAKCNGYEIHIIDPAQGQGYAVWYALNKVINCPYSLKWEDDFKAEEDIPLNDCVQLMNKYPHINQICFNKRETMRCKTVQGENGYYEWIKEQRYFDVEDRKIPLVVKEKWWFGTSVWRTSYIKPLFRYWAVNTHNKLNDEVLLPLAGYKEGEKGTRKGIVIPTPSDVEKNIGCYIYGKTADKRMVEHCGVGDSIFVGQFQKRMKEEGKKIIGDIIRG